MRIAVLVKRFVITGGAEKYAVEIASRLLKRGHEVHLYAREVDPLLLQGIHHHQVPNRLMFSSALNSYSFAKDVATMLKHESYDIIHSHEKSFLQDVATIHTFPYLQGMVHMSRLKKFDRLYLSPRAWLHLYLEKKQYQTPHLVAGSRSLQADITKYSGYKPQQVITPGVDTTEFSAAWSQDHRHSLRHAQGIDDDQLLILFAGSDFKRKGLDELIPAIGRDMQLCVVGRGERHEHYQQLVASAGLTEQVHFKGLSEQMREQYAAADIVVLPARVEAFGMVILEAMASGCTVIVSKGAGVSALIASGENGLTMGLPQELPHLLESLRDPLVRHKLGQNASKTAAEHTWDKATDAYEKLFLQVAAANKAKAVAMNSANG
ncbi:MAG: UDP-glucose:(heptosyl)LPS alpha-1,3-glucosyltransferase [Candidatus Azotimanducaceae bacterium]|jgi:UDP-glucose:(heptosyl)LPS alpha-1,3-glucosyltransferase